MVSRPFPSQILQITDIGARINLMHLTSVEIITGVINT